MSVPRAKPMHALESALVGALFAWARSGSLASAHARGARIGSLARMLGLRRRVAEANLALAFPERSASERAAILAAHYRELGRVAFEYPRLPHLSREAELGTFATIDGVEHLEALRGRGAILMSGHYGNFELLGSVLARWNPVDFVVKPLSNPLVEQRIAALRSEAGIGAIPTGAGVRGVLKALRAGHWVAMLADQDARRHGVFVPFFGRPASTPEGPARLALAAGAPLLFGAVHREPDGRHKLLLDAPHYGEGSADDEAAVLALTRWHVERLEARIREHPEMWFWLHKRWKTAPPAGAARGE